MLPPQEYLENEHGLIFNGPPDGYETLPWYYGQYSQLSLDGAPFPPPRRVVIIV